MKYGRSIYINMRGKKKSEIDWLFSDWIRIVEEESVSVYGGGTDRVGDFLFTLEPPNNKSKIPKKSLSKIYNSILKKFPKTEVLLSKEWDLNSDIELEMVIDKDDVLSRLEKWPLAKS